MSLNYVEQPRIEQPRIEQPCIEQPCVEQPVGCAAGASDVFRLCKTAFAVAQQPLDLQVGCRLQGRFAVLAGHRLAETTEQTS